MQSTDEILKKFKQNNVISENDLCSSERAEIIKKFITRLNEDRRTTGYKALPAKFYAIRLAEARLSTQDLYWFYGYCSDSKNFSKTWWGALKPKK